MQTLLFRWPVYALKIAPAHVSRATSLNRPLHSCSRMILNYILVSSSAWLLPLPQRVNISNKNSYSFTEETHRLRQFHHMTSYNLIFYFILPIICSLFNMIINSYLICIIYNYYIILYNNIFHMIIQPDP